MKRIIVGTWAVLSAASVMAQSILTFSNANPVFAPEPGNPTESKSGNSPPQTYTGAKLAGPNYWAQLFAGPVGALESSLAGCTPVTTFRSGAAAGFIAPVNVTLTGIAPGSSATLEMRVWDNSSGSYPSWASAEPAWLAGAIPAGKSDLLNELLGGGVNPPPQPGTSWESFNIYSIPEPTAAALMALGAAAFWAKHRRR